MRRWLAILCCALFAFCSLGQNATISISTLNCYWFFDGGSMKGDFPRTKIDYTTKAGHLIGLLPSEAPLFVGFQEVGTKDDIDALAASATARFKHPYRALFVQGKDSATGQDVAAIFDAAAGWGIHGRPSRHSDLEKDLSKHLVVRLTNAVTAIDICVVHLRRPIGADGKEKQSQQCRALMRWAMRHLAAQPKANLVILGDFNEAAPVKSSNSAVAVLFRTEPPMFDALSILEDRVATHANGRAYDRIILSDAIAQGANNLKLESVGVQKHRHGSGHERRAYTDHFPVTATIRLKP